MAAESIGVDSENLFVLDAGRAKNEISNLISRRQINDRRKITSALCESICKRIASYIDCADNLLCIDSKPIEVCCPVRGKRCKMGNTDFATAPNFGYCVSLGRYYYGYKFHSVCGLEGVIHSFDMTTKASVHDIPYLEDVRHQYRDCGIIARIRNLTSLKRPI